MSGWIVLKRASRGISHWVAKLGEEWIDRMSLLSAFGNVLRGRCHVFKRKSDFVGISPADVG